MEYFVGREDDLAKLYNYLILNCDKEPLLKIIRIEGSGGIGKTYFLEEFLQRNKDGINKNKILTMKVKGTEEELNIIDIVKSFISSAKIKNSLSISSKYFADTNNLIKRIEYLKNQILSEIRKKNPNLTEDDGKALSKIIDHSLSIGIDVVSISSGNYLTGPLNLFKNLIRLFNDIESIKPASYNFLDTLLLKVNLSNKELDNQIKKEACKILAETFSKDIQAFVKKYHFSEILKPKASKNKDIDRILIIIDDYEKIYKTMNTFLVKHFLPEINRNYDFSTSIVIIGRDRLECTAPACDQDFNKNLKGRIELKPLSKEELYSLIESYGINSNEEKERAWKDTQGYPFYVKLWQEERQSGGRTAVMLKRFYDRITRWMSVEEKNWLEKIIFLKDINQNSLEKFFDEEEAKSVFNWFESEGSLRDTNSKTYQIREYLRSRLIEYFKLINPEKFKKLS